MIDKSKEYSYTGIPTFSKSDYGSIEQLSEYQIGVFGVPMDTGTSNRFGTRLGPSAIRQASTEYNPNILPERITLIDLFQSQKEIDVSYPRILDLGDVTIYPTDYSRTLESIEQFSYEVRKRAFPIVLGGDHSMTYPVVKGLIRSLQEKTPSIKPGIIHFDSHPDIWESFITLDHVWHGSPFRNLLDENIIQGQLLVMIGDRSLLSTNDYSYLLEHNVHLYSISDIWERGIVSILEEATLYLRDQSDGVYISIDIDVFDPCYAPGTGTPVPGGLSPREMIQAVDIICRTNHLIGIDLVKVAPNYDPSESTQNLAAFLLNRFLQLYGGF